ncbi:MAG: hypothetical protein DRQ43_03270 [Gammaproteobacteria bacterium]|nr:MAG: hypothetical protein DRQ43_03270 [Gammaproteobacteria bacterium]
MTYPTINNLHVDILTNALITSDVALPVGTVIDWDYNGVASGTYGPTLVTLSSIYLSEIVGSQASLQGHSGTDEWQIDITVDGPADYQITVEPVAQLDGIDYPYGGSDVVDVQFITEPTANAGTGGEVCLDASFQLAAVPSIGTGAWTQISEPVGGVATFVDPALATTTVSVDIEGSYVLRWTESNGICEDFAEITVIYNPNPEPEITGVLEVCAGSLGVGYSTPAVAGDQYLWNVSGGTIVSGQGTNAITVDWFDISPGIVTVTQYAAVTFCSTSTSENVTLIALPDPIITGPETVVINSNENYSTTDTPFHGYTWTVTGGVISGLNNLSSIDVIWPGTPGTGTVSVTELNLLSGCVGSSETMDVTITTGGVTISGYFTYHNSANTPLEGLSLMLMDGPSAGGTTTTDATGYYEFTNVLDGTYTVDVVTTYPHQGINSLDAGQVNFWWTGPASIQRVRWNAGDVNASNLIQATDAGFIQGHFVFGTPFTRGEWTFWKQPDASNLNPTTSTNDVVVSGTNVIQGFYGLCVGDFNGSNIPSTTKAMDASDLLLTYAGTMEMGTDMEFELPIKVTNSMQIAALSLILDIPSNLVSVEDVYISDGNNQVGMLDFNVVGNELRIGWNDIAALDLTNDSRLLTLKLRTTENFTSGEQISIALRPDPLNELADGQYKVIENAVLSTYVVEYSATGIGEIGLSEGTSMEAFPNPFNEYTTVNYSIPVDADVILEVYNTHGALVETLVDEMQSRGDYSVKFQGLRYRAGVYTVVIRVKTNNHAITHTMKIVLNTN